MHIFIMEIRKSMMETQNLVMIHGSLRAPRAPREDIFGKIHCDYLDFTDY